MQPDEHPRDKAGRDAVARCRICGDFNAPRGRPTWDAIAAKYKDNIPEHYKSSIDAMHRAGALPYLVDGIFTTPGYRADNVELHEGISDHKAITATITKL